MKYITPFLERITKKAAHVIHPIAPAFARVSGILLGQHMRKRGAEPAQLGVGQRRDDLRQLVVHCIGAVEERLAADDRNRRKPGWKNALVRTGAVICIELVKDRSETAALHSTENDQTIVAAVPVFNIAVVLYGDLTGSSAACAVLHGEIHRRQHTDEIGICLQVYLFKSKIVAEDRDAVTAGKAAELRIERGDEDGGEPLGVRLQHVTEAAQIEGLIHPVATIIFNRRLGRMVHRGSDLLRLRRDTVRDVPVGLQLIVCQLDVRQLELALCEGHRNGVQTAAAGTAQVQQTMTVGVAVDDGCPRVVPEGKAGNGDAVGNGRAVVRPLKTVVRLDTLDVLFDAMHEFLLTALFRKAYLAERDDLLDLSCCDRRTENFGDFHGFLTSFRILWHYFTTRKNTFHYGVFFMNR